MRFKNVVSARQWVAVIAGVLCALLFAGCGLRGGNVPLEINSSLRIVKMSISSANVFIVEQGRSRLMIDAGNPGDELELERLMEDHGIDPASIDYLVLTHGHLDHAGTAAYFQDTYGIQLIGGEGDQPMMHLEGRADLCPTGILARMIRIAQRGKTYPAFTLDIALPSRPAPPLNLADLGMEGQIVSWPGHTDGSLVLIVGEHAFVGDLIRGGILNANQPETHFFLCDLDENRERIRELLTYDAVTTWHTGHFGSLAVKDVEAYLGD